MRKRQALTNIDQHLFVWLLPLVPLYRRRPCDCQAANDHSAGTVLAFGPIALANRATELADRKSRLRCRLIGEMSRANPLWGAPRNHVELLKLGFEVAQSTVSNT
jgi:hypothetical protein